MTASGLLNQVIYCCPFVPPEWIEAHGFDALRIIPDDTAILGAGMCGYAEAYLRSVARQEGVVVFTTACDQMRRAAERLSMQGRPHVFLLNVPATWQSAQAYKLYASELRRLGNYLSALGGKPPDYRRLSDIMAMHDGRRVTSRSLSLSGGQPRVAWVGAHLTRLQCRWQEETRRMGMHIDLVATPDGDVMLPRPFSRAALEHDPFDELVSAYLALPGIQRRPNSLFYQWLERHLPLYNIQGIIYACGVWCDLWRAEARRLQQWLDLPVVTLELLGDPAHDHRTRTRLEAFMERLIR